MRLGRCYRRFGAKLRQYGLPHEPVEEMCSAGAIAVVHSPNRFDVMNHLE